MFWREKLGYFRGSNKKNFNFFYKALIFNNIQYKNFFIFCLTNEKKCYICIVKQTKKTNKKSNNKNFNNMKTIEIKNINGDVLFSHTAEDNTITLTVETAVSCGVSLANANLAGTCLAVADLEGADLEGADLNGADISWADLEGANLKGSNLKDADIKGAFLEGADLTEADITGANINWANLNGAKNIPFIPLSCPSEGAFIGWKKVEGKYLVKLQVPEDARRCSATTRKCRCDKALVLDITSLDGETHFDEVVNNNYKKTIYKVGEFVYPDSFDENRWCECSHGIHFFVNKQDAINY